LKRCLAARSTGFGGEVGRPYLVASAMAPPLGSMCAIAKTDKKILYAPVGNTLFYYRFFFFCLCPEMPKAGLWFLIVRPGKGCPMQQSPAWRRIGLS
jgi:hypothetical protein